MQDCTQLSYNEALIVNQILDQLSSHICYDTKANNFFIKMPFSITMDNSTKNNFLDVLEKTNPDDLPF
jgi:hypothetical protein